MAVSALTLEGKAAIATSAGHGIGRATALSPASGGANVVVSDVDMPATESTASEIVISGRHAIAVHTDLTSQSDPTALADRAMYIRYLNDFPPGSPCL